MALRPQKVDLVELKRQNASLDWGFGKVNLVGCLVQV